MTTCINCDKEATHKYNQLKEMCEECYLKIVEIVKAIVNNETFRP